MNLPRRNVYCYVLASISAVCLIIPFTAASPAEPAFVHDDGAGTMAPVIGGRLIEKLREEPVPETVAVWIFFTDHGSCDTGGRDSRTHAAGVSRRALKRMRLRTSCPVDGYGLRSPDAGYIDRLRPHVRRFRCRSRYFNAVSADVSIQRISTIASYPFVRRIDLIASFRRPKEIAPPERSPAVFRSAGGDRGYGAFGESYTQLSQIQASKLLELGYNGSGVNRGIAPILICVLDTGFKLDHEAFTQTNIVAQWDFIQNDSVTSNEPGDSPSQDMHGTTVLGVLGGYSEGELVGPAWGAEYLLAKTELYTIELEIEEDYWIAGLEWADSSGADIVSSSLGYVLWYSKADLDGETPLCTRAADRAVSRGIVVVNSTGNFGPSDSLIAPADGDSVLAVGAVDRYGDIAYFSSRGPTIDGRIKPELVAMGMGTYSVFKGTVDEYARYNGTSYSAPLVAGLCAQLLEIHPEWSPMELRQALLFTASRSGMPDNTYGYGIPHGLAAAGFDPDEPLFSSAVPNPFRTSTSFQFYFPQPEPVTMRIYDIRGALVKTLARNLPIQRGWTVSWDGTNNAGRQVTAGVYFLELTSPAVHRICKLVRLR